MEFDKSRVYTTLNAEDLPIGSKCIFADDLDSLREKVQEAEFHVSKLTAVEQDCALYRFDDNDDAYALAYLVELPKEPKHKPFYDTATAFKTIAAHGGWLKDDDTYYLVTGVNLIKEVEICIRDYWISATYALENFTFADDDSPVGVKVDDTRAARLNLNL